MVVDVVLLLDAFETDAVDLLMTEAETAATAGAPPPASASAARLLPQKICIKMQGFGRFPAFGKRFLRS